ncbi:MAG: metallo-mystery pair system four-Cys motif protein [Woeseiaceae bacterium]|nr:metallo-mystery pair system four-Cys motif protein [Woeseiaceae bacterium]
MSLSCSRWDLALNIPFVATWNGTPVSCGSGDPALSDMRFYISNPQVVAADGEARDVRFAVEHAWQNDAVALVDLEDGTGACQNGTKEVVAEVIGVVRAGEYRTLRFTVGVPFQLNHANPLTASQPLDDPDMHWHWRSGYKFLRAGVRTNADSFWIHAGSAGCEGTVGNITGCRFPNRIVVELDGFVPGESTVAVDLARLATGTDLADGEPTDCSSGPAEESCVEPFRALGIDFATGLPVGEQSVFSLQ